MASEENKWQEYRSLWEQSAGAYGGGETGDYREIAPSQAWFSGSPLSIFVCPIHPWTIFLCTSSRKQEGDKMQSET